MFKTAEICRFVIRTTDLKDPLEAERSRMTTITKEASKAAGRASEAERVSKAAKGPYSLEGLKVSWGGWSHCPKGALRVYWSPKGTSGLF